MSHETPSDRAITNVIWYTCTCAFGLTGLCELLGRLFVHSSGHLHAHCPCPGDGWERESLEITV